MATVGQQLLAPEAGWARYDNDNPMFTYGGTWSNSSNSTDYNSTLKYTNQVGATISFTFSGVGIRLISQLRTSTNRNNLCTISIDGGASETITMVNSSVVSQGLSYEKTGLEDKTHTALITTVGLDSNITFNLDAIDIMSKQKVNKILLLSSDGTYSLEKGGYTENLIPPMTSNTAPSGVVSASSSHASFPAWKAFDGNHDSTWFTPDGTTTGWLQYEFTTEVKVDKYIIYIRTSDRSPKDWTFEGSNDGITWDILDTQIGVADWVDYENRGFNIESTKPYRLYRLNTTKNNGNATNLAIHEIELVEYVNSIIKKLPSKSEQNFINYGIDSPVQLNEIFSSKNYILQDTVSEDVNGLWTTQINRKPLSIKF